MNMVNTWRHRHSSINARAAVVRRGVTALAIPIALFALVCGTCPLPAGASTNGDVPGPSDLAATFAGIENSARYDDSDWGYLVVDQETGKVLAAQNAQKMFDPGSTMKIYSTMTALQAYGPDYRFRTPIYREGSVSGGTLHGNLVLVGSGDLTFGLREQANGTLAYENLPALDYSYANIGLPDAVEPKGDPLAALDQLAGMVRQAGITSVDGNVVIDDRLFTPYNGFPDGLISPIWVNENLIDIEVGPGPVGQPATVNWRPMTASYTVQNQVTTVAAGKTTSVAVSEPTPGTLVVTGHIAAGSQPTLVVSEIKDPSAFARTALIEALQRAGVSVSAAPTGPNPSALLPPKGGYQASDMIGEHVSTTLAQYITLILKVSYNRGADLMTCLAAVSMGSTDCQQGLVAEHKTITSFGVPSSGATLFDGAGSDDSNRSTPSALVTFLRHATTTQNGKYLLDALPILGRDGTLANVLPTSPAAGHAQIKTGNRVVGNAADQIIVLGNSLAGYVETKSGRKVAVMIAVGDVPLSTSAGFLHVTADQAKMVEAVQQDL